MDEAAVIFNAFFLQNPAKYACFFMHSLHCLCQITLKLFHLPLL